MKEKIIDQLKLVGYITGVCVALIGSASAIVKPHAKLFVKRVHAEEEKNLCTKVDSLIAIVERSNKELKENVDKTYFILMESIPRQRRVLALKKFKEYYAKETE